MGFKPTLPSFHVPSERDGFHAQRVPVHPHSRHDEAKQGIRRNRPLRKPSIARSSGLEGTSGKRTTGSCTRRKGRADRRNPPIAHVRHEVWKAAAKHGRSPTGMGRRLPGLQAAQEEAQSTQTKRRRCRCGKPKKKKKDANETFGHRAGGKRVGRRTSVERDANEVEWKTTTQGTVRKRENG